MRVVRVSMAGEAEATQYESCENPVGEARRSHPVVFLIFAGWIHRLRNLTIPATQRAKSNLQGAANR